MTCAKFLHHGGTHAQVHRTPTPAQVYRFAVAFCAATPGLPIRRRKVTSEVLATVLFAAAVRISPSPRPAAASGTHPARRPMPTPCTPTSSASRSPTARSTPPSSTTCPAPLRRPRKRPLRLGVDLTLSPYYGQHSLESREIYRSQAKLRDGTALFAYATAHLVSPGPAVHLGRDSRGTALASASRRYSRSCCSW